MRHSSVRLLPAFLMLILLASCGGGDGGTPATPTPTPGPGDGGTPPTPTQVVLQDCLAPALRDGFDVLAVFNELIQGMGTAAGFAILPGGIQHADDPGASFLEIQLLYDADGDMQPDGQTTLRFLDGAGDPTQPFAAPDLDALLNGTVDTLGTILPNLPDDTHLRVEFNASEGTVQGANLDLTFTGGAAAATEGSVNVMAAECVTVLTWIATAWGDLQADLATTFPKVLLEVVADSLTDSVVGDLAMDATSTAVATVSRNAGPQEIWNLDLLTGTATAP